MALNIPFSFDLTPSGHQLLPNMKTHFSGNQYRIDDQVIYTEDDNFDHQAKFYQWDRSNASPMEYVCESEREQCLKKEPHSVTFQTTIVVGL